LRLPVGLFVGREFFGVLDLVGVDICHVFLVAGLLVIPGLGPLPAFEKDPAAFMEVLGHDLGAFAKGLDVEPLSVFLWFAGTVLPAFGAGDGEGGDGCATSGLLHFRVFAQVSDQQSLLHGVVSCNGSCEVTRNGESGQSGLCHLAADGAEALVSRGRR